MSFDNLGLAPEILSAVRATNYKTPTPIQKRAIPAILEGLDLIGCAQTGTGKTAGFTLPMLHRLRGGRSRSLRALVLVPTRELAAQVNESIRTYGRFLRLRTGVVIGGIGIRPQEETLRRGIDILVATPGRLLDHLRQRNLHFRDLEVLVIDEADRMLDMGFIPDIRRILHQIPARRQTLLFSATMPEEIRKLTRDFMKDPKMIEIVPYGTPADGIRHVVHPVAPHRKRDLLIHLLKDKKMTQVLIFTRTKRRAEDLAHKLDQAGIRVVALHGNKSQGARKQALDSFRRGSIKALVATNLAARGLDVKGISHVINYEFPETPEDYIHRIGRTARAEATGDAVSLMASDEREKLRAIERLIGRKIPQETVPGFESGGNSREPLKPKANSFRPNQRTRSDRPDQKVKSARSLQMGWHAGKRTVLSR